MFGAGVRAHYVTSVLAAALMVEQRSGLIVNVSADAAAMAGSGVAYGAAKAATDRMAACMADELREHGVAAVALYPGLVRTEAVLLAAEHFDLSDSESPQFVGRRLRHWPPTRRSCATPAGRSAPPNSPVSTTSPIWTGAARAPDRIAADVRGVLRVADAQGIGGRPDHHLGMRILTFRGSLLPSGEHLARWRVGCSKSGTQDRAHTGSNMKNGYVELARAQQERWQAAYAGNARLHGTEPSAAARWTARRFAAAGIDDLLELGAGQGRDTLYLARQGFSVHATDFSETALHQLRLDAQRDGLDERVTAALHDVRDPLPPADRTVGAVYANLLLSMALSRAELRSLTNEIHRVLRPGGLFVYTVWSIDALRPGSQDLGDGLTAHEGFAVRFFDRALVDELAERWEVAGVDSYDEGHEPYRLYRVSLVKPLE
jgi:NAD(P)-dependent dehydrogenase (short-subunit alcohol dehydrogenase family)